MNWLLFIISEYFYFILLYWFSLHWTVIQCISYICKDSTLVWLQFSFGELWDSDRWIINYFNIRGNNLLKHLNVLKNREHTFYGKIVFLENPLITWVLWWNLSNLKWVKFSIDQCCKAFSFVYYLYACCNIVCLFIHYVGGWN